MKVWILLGCVGSLVSSPQNSWNFEDPFSRDIYQPDVVRSSRSEGSAPEQRQDPAFSSNQDQGFNIPFPSDFSFSEFSSPFGNGQGFQQFLSGLGGEQVNNPSEFSQRETPEFQIPSRGQVEQQPFKRGADARQLDRFPEDFERPQPVYVQAPTRHIKPVRPEYTSPSFTAESVRREYTPEYKPEYKPVYKPEYTEYKPVQQVQKKPVVPERQQEAIRPFDSFDEDNFSGSFGEEDFNMDFEIPKFEIQKEEIAEEAQTFYRTTSASPAETSFYTSKPAESYVKANPTEERNTFFSDQPAVEAIDDSFFKLNPSEEIGSYFKPSQDEIPAFYQPEPLKETKKNNFKPPALVERFNTPIVEPSLPYQPEEPEYNKPEPKSQFSESLSMGENMKAMNEEFESMQKVSFPQPDQPALPQLPEVAKSQFKPEPTKKPYMPEQKYEKPYQPEQKYEKKNFRAPLKTPERSSEEHPVVRIKRPESRSQTQPEYRSFSAPAPNSRQGHQQGHFDNSYRPSQQEPSRPGQLEIVEVHKAKVQDVYDNEQEIITLSPLKKFSSDGGKQSFNVDVKASFSPQLGPGPQVSVEKRRGFVQNPFTAHQRSLVAGPGAPVQQRSHIAASVQQRPMSSALGAPVQRSLGGAPVQQRPLGGAPVQKSTGLMGLPGLPSLQFKRKRVLKN